MLRYFVQEGVKIVLANPQHLLHPCSQSSQADTGSSPQAFPFTYEHLLILLAASLHLRE